MELRNLIQQEINAIMQGGRIQRVNEPYQGNKPDRKTTPKKAVIQYTKDGKYIQEFPSISAANRHFSLSDKCMSKHLRGKFKTLKGFVFRYKEEL